MDRLNLSISAVLPDRPKRIVALILVEMPEDATNGDGDDGSSPLPPDPSDESLRSIDVLFDVLSDRRSRLVLSHLETVSVSVMDLDELAEHVAESEAESEAVPDSEEHCERVATSLHHKCLPKLDEEAVLDYDPRTNTVRYWGDDRVTACLELIESEDER